MPRKPRMYLEGIPCHVIQRGNNRDASFFSNQDFYFYLDCLGNACKRYNVSLHAYVLMTNHVHLLMTPRYAAGISRVMQSLGRLYVQYINKEYRRSGTLWEGRHKACIVDAESYLLTCMRYIELNPVRAGMVEHLAEYPWSSYRINAQAENDSLINMHECYVRLGGTTEIRCQQYRRLFANQLEGEDIHTIRNALEYSIPLGDGRFIRQIEAALGQKVGYAKRGRPRVLDEAAGYLVWE
jgi:putative transposase